MLARVLVVQWESEQLFTVDPRTGQPLFYPLSRGITGNTVTQPELYRVTDFSRRNEAYDPEVDSMNTILDVGGETLNPKP